MQSKAAIGRIGKYTHKQTTQCHNQCLTTAEHPVL